MIPRLLITAAVIAAGLCVGLTLAGWLANLEPDEEETSRVHDH